MTSVYSNSNENDEISVNKSEYKIIIQLDF
jgi:hypothetical protein